MGRFNMRLRGNTGAAPPDTTPDDFTIPAKTGQALDSDIWSADITPTGYDADTAISGTGLGVQIAGGSAVSSGAISPGQSFKIGLHSSASNSTLATATATVGGKSATFDVTTLADAGAGVATIGPHASFNGTAGSGDAAPSGSATRTKDDPPMAIGRIVTYPGQRVAASLLLKIPCDALGGIDRVELSGDCEATTITGMSLVDFVDVNGVTHKEFYHAAWLDTAAFVAKGGADGTRRANIYAKVYATDGDITPRVLSWWFIPASTEFDGTYTVGSGKTYSTIKGALEAAKNDGKKNPNIEIWTTASYEMENSTWGIYTGGHGHAVITARPGVTATIGRAAAFNPASESAAKWTPGWDGIEFRGAGIVIDVKNTTQVVTSAKPCFINGCKITNSVGTRDTLYWNKSPHPGWGISVASWFQYHDVKFTSGMYVDAAAVVGGTSLEAWADVYTGCPINYGSHDENISNEWFRTELSALTVRYSGSGSATIAKTGGNGGGFLVCTDPAGHLDIDLGGIFALVEVQAVADAINARSGWSATVHDTTRAARFLLGSGFGDRNGFTAVDAKTADVGLITFIDIHGDGTQTYGGKENYVYWNWTCDEASGANFFSNFLFFDGTTSPAGTLTDRDMSFVNLVLLGESNDLVSGGTGAHHILLRHITTSQWFSPGTGSQETYTEVSACLMSGVGTYGDPAAGPAIHFVNNVYTIRPSASMWTGATWTGNLQIGTSAIANPTASWLTAPEDHDFTPTGAALTALVPSVFPYDQRGVLRSANDCAGAWSKNAA